MKIIFKGIIVSMFFVAPIFSMNSEVRKQENSEIIKHFLDNVFVYNESIKTLDYKILLQEKEYLDANPYHDKYVISSYIPDNEMNIVYRLFKNDLNIIAFASKEDKIKNTRYFVDNEDDNICYILYDEEKIGKKYTEDTISYEEHKDLKSFIEWAFVVLGGLNKTTNIDPIFLSKLKKFAVISNEEIFYNK